MKIRKNIELFGVKNCPFCGSDNIGFKDNIIEFNLGGEGPSTCTKRVWAYCRRCGAEGPKGTGEFVTDAEEIAFSVEKWNKRKGE